MDLRAELTALGFGPTAVALPGEEPPAPLAEGALRLRRAHDGFVLETVDYGQGHPLGEAPTEAAARTLLLDYVRRVLPGERALPRAELDELVRSRAGHYGDLRAMLGAAAAEQRHVVIDLPAGLPIDRIGVLDGVHAFPLDTPYDWRSLPPVRPDSHLHRFLTTTAVRVRPVVVQPWFGRPGGGIRFTLQEPRTGLRDLVVRGDLVRLRVV